MKNNFQAYPLIIFTLVLIALVNACSSIDNPTYGPVKDVNVQHELLKSIADDTQDVIFYSRAIWYPNKNGFNFLPAGKKSRKGVIVYTDQSVYFAEWASKQYMPVFSLNYDQINELRLAASDLFGRMVIKTDSYNSFEILGIDGPDLPNKEETNIAFQLLEQQKKN